MRARQTNAFRRPCTRCIQLTGAWMQYLGTKFRIIVRIDNNAVNSLELGARIEPKKQVKLMHGCDSQAGSAHSSVQGANHRSRCLERIGFSQPVGLLVL